MSQPVIAYVNGTGGRWLSAVLYGIENNMKALPVLQRTNFHSEGQSAYFHFLHNDTGVPAAYTFSGRCRFNLFINSWLKWRAAENHCGFNQLPIEQKIYALSNDARWRNSPVYSNSYETKIDLDYANIFMDPGTFRKQLLSILTPHWPQEYITRVTTGYIDSAAEAFKITAIDPKEHLGNVDSLGWLAWCHALCLLNSVSIPCQIASNHNDYRAWLTDNQAWILKQTELFVL